MIGRKKNKKKKKLTHFPKCYKTVDTSSYDVRKKKWGGVSMCSVYI